MEERQEIIGKTQHNINNYMNNKINQRRDLESDAICDVGSKVG